MGPIASILTKFWSGSLIDRMNKRNLMITADIIRAFFVAIIPFLHSIWLIYICLFLLAVAKAFFEPTSMAYITGIVPQKNRKQFNSFRSLITSGAFLIGPAIAGVLLLIADAKIAIWINAFSFLLSALMLFLLPDLEKVESKGAARAVSLNVLKEDWKAVLHFSRRESYVVKIYFIAQFFMIVALGMDAQEVVFTQQVLNLTETDYGLLISITGIGSLIGASAVSALSKKMSIKMLMGLGYSITAAGYMIYALSFSFLSVTIGFVIIGFFNAFFNTGFMTFYQNNVPVEMMGRISSVFGTFQSLFQILFVLLIGFTGELFPLRQSLIASSLLMLFVSGLLILFLARSAYSKYYAEEAQA